MSLAADVISAMVSKPAETGSLSALTSF